LWIRRHQWRRRRRSLDKSATLLGLFFGGVTLTASLLTILRAHVPHLIVEAAPALRNFRPAISHGFFSRRITLTAPLTTNVERGFDDLPVDAAKTSVAAMSERLFARWITLSAVLFALGGVHVDDVSIDATPAEISAVLFCFLFGRITLTFSLATLRRRRVNDLAVNAAPAAWLWWRRRCRRRIICRGRWRPVSWRRRRW